MRLIVGLIVDGAPTWHISAASGNYTTLCGLGDNDPAVGLGKVLEAERGQRVTCADCRATWEHVRKLRGRNFV